MTPPTTLFRDATVAVDRAALETRAEGDERIPIAISSEHPVERFDWMTGERYLEVLVHEAGAVDLSRAGEGLPLLLNHSSREQVGLVEDISVDSDRRLRGFARFSRSQQGQEVRADILDGIRKNVSVGYATGDDYEQSKNAAEKTVRRYRRWTPYEVSSVPIPADPTVGVGRSASPGTPPAPLTPPADEARSIRMSVQDNAAGAPAAPTAPAGPTREQVIYDMCEAAGLGVKDARELAASGKGIREISDVLVGKLRAAAPSAPAPVHVELTQREQREYSIVRALNALVEKRRSGFEFEVSDSIAKMMGRSTEGVFVPTSISAQNPAAAPDQRTQLSLAAGAGKGTEAKFTEYGGFIDLLRSRMVTTSMGAQMLSGLQGDLAFVNQSAAGTFAWGTETASASLSSLSTASRTMAPKVGQSATSVSRQLLRQAVFDVENLVRNDIATVHALGIDLAGLHGTGSSNQPRGVTNVSGIGSVVGGTNGAQPTYDNLVDLQKEVAIDNALAGSLGYVVHPLIAARLMKTQQFASTNGVPVWTGNILDGQVAGFKAMASTQVLSAQTKGTSTDCSPIIFGDWSSLIIGEWGSMELIVDPYTIGPALVKLMSIQMIDVLCRYPEKFAVMADARI